jgi:hypothetical protein
MKVARSVSCRRRSAGIMLVQCLVYFTVFAILAGVGTAAFYVCWDNANALFYATDDINSALWAGERWRADVRATTGQPAVEQSPAGQVMRIPEREGEIVYRFEAGELRREIPSAHVSQLLLPSVKTSQMSREGRDGVAAWRWELDVKVRRPQSQLPLLFTFETVQAKP